MGSYRRGRKFLIAFEPSEGRERVASCAAAGEAVTLALAEEPAPVVTDDGGLARRTYDQRTHNIGREV